MFVSVIDVYLFKIISIEYNNYDSKIISKIINK